MGKVKEVYMDLQTQAWEILERNPSETFDSLVGQVVSNNKPELADWAYEIVEEVWDEYKVHGFNGDDSAYRYELA